MDLASALVIVAGSYSLPEFGICFYERKIGLSVEYTYFFGWCHKVFHSFLIQKITLFFLLKGKDAIERMKGFFGVSVEEATFIGGLLLDSSFITCKTFANSFRGDNTRYSLVNQVSKKRKNKKKQQQN